MNQVALFTSLLVFSLSSAPTQLHLNQCQIPKALKLLLPSQSFQVCNLARSTAWVDPVWARPQHSLAIPKVTTDHGIFMRCLVSNHQHHRAPRAQGQGEDSEPVLSHPSFPEKSLNKCLPPRRNQFAFLLLSQQEDQRRKPQRETTPYTEWNKGDW